MTPRRAIARTLRLLLTAFAFVLAGGGPPAEAAGCAGAHLIPTAANLARVRAATLCLIDRQRLIHGLRRLRPDTALADSAEVRAVEMVTRDRFADAGPAGGTLLGRVLAAGYATAAGEIRELGENIAAASRSLATPADAVRMWMRSPAHRAQILDPAFRDTGIGVVAALPRALRLGPSGATYAEDFGARA
jgi:Cysteine-rich secretory protein family